MLKVRIYLALLVALLGMVLGALVIVRGGVLGPFSKKLIDARMGVVVAMADEIESARAPMKKLRRISRHLNVEAKFTKEIPFKEEFPPKKVAYQERELFLLKGKRTPMAIALDIDRKRKWMVVWFPVDIEEPRRRIGVGLLVLALFGAMGAWGLGRWSLQPLERATSAMNRIAEGDLKHRVSNPIGPAGEAFNQMAERLEEVIEGQRDFMAAVGHELRTPIARLKLQAELLEGLEKNRIESLQADILELEDLVEALLESARLERGAVALQRTEQNLYDMFMEALSKIDVEERSVCLEVDPELSFSIDRRLMMRLLLNLLSNIVRYTPVDCVIWMGARFEREALILWVADNGDGIEDSLRTAIFDPFVREEKSRSKKTGGLGLGLMLVRQVAQVHGGGVVAKKTDRMHGGMSFNQGLEIEVLLPIAAV
ncbi:MAG: ATP-binding protein [Myxococcota bacterium]|nr:ATP-binding protein [Myxococcota bacterium]